MTETFEFGSSRGGTGVLAPPRRRRRRPAKKHDGGSLPPIPPDDFDGGEWNRWEGNEPEPEPEHRAPLPGTPDDAATFALKIFLFGIAVLFLILLATWLLLRKDAAQWPPAGSPSPPAILWVSTALLALSSATVAGAVRAARRNQRSGTARWLGWSVLLGLAFLSAQLFLWSDLAASGLLPSTNGYGAAFYALTGVHGLHVAGGLTTLAVLLVRTRRSRPGRAPGREARLCAVYWHFMGILWGILFAVIYFLR